MVYDSFIYFFLGYIGNFELVDHHREGNIIVEIKEALNKCGVMNLDFNVRVTEIERWTSCFLPSRHVLLCGRTSLGFPLKL